MIKPAVNVIRITLEQRKSSKSTIDDIIDVINKTIRSSDCKKAH
jgi:hypothetical protein